MHAADLLAHLDRIRHAPSAEEVRGRLVTATGVYGIDQVMCGLLPAPSTPPDEARKSIFFGNWPAEWLERYVARRYVEIDPVISQIAATDAMFDWREARAPTDRAPLARRMMEEAREHGLSAGFALPFSGPAGGRGSISLSGERIELDPAHRTTLALLAAGAAERAAVLVHGERWRPASPLTGRERDCVAWAAEGKTEWETAAILGIAPRTVESHLAAARRKLDAANKVHLVARAFRLGLIG
ncbi:LuxR family transcriptional regulator [Stappia sp. 28M-7]|uniref:LuxR family transcriptional regulator n=1 Tax=Stappia sp. 28M-7 TaxID=2762596 RepID=UPI00163BDA8B|nr:LuxR family transcriptional regulator [Stappia sp. 28M-7]MBC2859866.1 LuxR family transcriptional regulator [Stappia sp. 28M-7]